ncbi:pyridoxamine 5'-phosphate oxidase family protein [Paenibacillus sp. SYP-B3998]|uniref:Pyridoxamine 5'-phosphate oxidase family protein n=1 Tax=Paenibacillus sp. SYP-B3998 TaxID=2678564 RepID=A0A6G4A115_9BACL|nr:pyridoxamine 5'-phosphate oxidase family protein [Paenibacillus sp. SYP-B3998]NEW07988.1 pyridoxamine 5'-phosphate oxidase family protein [Paenibacillus sp. SYP-B3998]
MGKLFEVMQPEHEAFIAKQHIFFVGSAPLDAEGHVNLSPKGHDVLRILSQTEVAYLDLTGSGNETSAHLEENGRITLMFTAFDGPPMILRLYGEGRVVLPGTSEWEKLAPRFTLLPGARQIIVVSIHAVKTSCGFSIPFYNYEGERNTLQQWAVHQGEQGINKYHREKNMMSMDGLVTTIGQKLSTGILGIED